MTVARMRVREDADIKARKIANNLAWNYGITVPEYNLMLEQQNYACALCGKTEQEAGRRLCVDHDHATGKVRSLLCRSCNSMIGYAKDSPELLNKGAAYVEQAKEIVA